MITILTVGTVALAPSPLAKKEEVNKMKFNDDFINKCDGCKNYKNGVCKSKEGCEFQSSFELTSKRIMIDTDVSYFENKIKINNITDHECAHILAEVILNIEKDRGAGFMIPFITMVMEHFKD